MKNLEIYKTLKEKISFDNVTYLGYMTPNKYEDLYKKTCTS